MRVGRIVKWTGIGFGAVFLAFLIWTFWLWRFFAPPPLNPPVENPIFSRSDCLIRVDVEYPGELTADEINRMGAFVHWVFGDTILERRYPVASQGWGYKDDYSYYILFTQKCDRKHEMVAQMVRDYEDKHPDEIRLTISSERVFPSIRTLLVEGDAWTDGYEPVPR